MTVIHTKEKPLRFVINCTMTLECGQQIKAYAKKRLGTMSRFIRRILMCAPWTSNHHIQIVMSVEKKLLKQPDQLRAALNEAVDLAVERLS